MRQMVDRRNAFLCTLRLLSISMLSLGGCDPVDSASLGGNVAGQRGEVQAVFINNTPGHVVFTFGTYDDQDPASRPDFEQFLLDDITAALPPDSESAVIELTCGRVLSLGSPMLLANIATNRPDAEVDESALVEGLDFYGDDSELLGSAAPFEARLGLDFPCNSLVVVYLEAQESGDFPFRVAFQVIPSSSSR